MLRNNFGYVMCTFVEVEFIAESVWTEPDLSVCVQESFIVIISNTTAIVDFTNHVTNG